MKPMTPDEFAGLLLLAILLVWSWRRAKRERLQASPESKHHPAIDGALLFAAGCILAFVSFEAANVAGSYNLSARESIAFGFPVIMVAGVLLTILSRTILKRKR